MSSPASSPPDACDIAVVALSARALAASARRGGLRALAIDLFADADTREHAARTVTARPSRRGLGFDRRSLLDAIARHAPLGLPIVLGAGLEHAPALMRAISARNPIIGATPETVAQLKDPSDFDTLLSDLDIPHPAVARSASGASGPSSWKGERGPRASEGRVGTAQDRAQSSGIELQAQRTPPSPPLSRGRDSEAAGLWLSKRAGASGGAHIHLATRRGGGRRYLQEFVPGRTISALFLADGRTSKIIGFSEQWTDPAPHAPFRYGGAVGPIALPARLASDIASAIDRIVAATGLTGLASADCIVGESGAGFQLIEVNPRPGATLDVFDHGDTPSLLRLHLDACDGLLPGVLPASTEARAAAIVYAERSVAGVTLRRPLWTADWPSCDESLPVGAPVCTVLAAAASPSAARTLVMERRAGLLAALLAAAPAPKVANTNDMVHA